MEVEHRYVKLNIHAESFPCRKVEYVRYWLSQVSRVQANSFHHLCNYLNHLILATYVRPE